MENKSSSFGIASMVCGIVSLVMCCCISYLGCIAAVAAIVLFILERTVAKTKSGMAVAGLVCGIITIAFTVIGLVLSAIIWDLIPEDIASEISSLMESSMAI
ncbi:MAG: hypothetical protein IJW10_05160 [Clostridia bacterium]|nr:hypothetical protein [Clostridia bacterium]